MFFCDFMSSYFKGSKTVKWMIFSGIYANITLARFLLVHMLNRKINFANKPEKLSQGLEGIFLIKDDRGSVTCITLLLQHVFYHCVYCCYYCYVHYVIMYYCH